MNIISNFLISFLDSSEGRLTFCITIFLFAIVAIMWYSRNVFVNREQSLKVLLSDLKKLQSQKIRLELAYLIDKATGSKAWFVEAYITDEQNNTFLLNYNCPIDGKSNFYDVMSLLVDTGYEISVKTDGPKIEGFRRTRKNQTHWR